MSFNPLNPVNTAPSPRPPAPSSAEDQARWDHTALRRRVLYAQHGTDVWQRVVASVGAIRARAWLPLDMSSNPLEQTWRQLAALYRSEPWIVGPHPDVIEAVAESGHWSLMQRVQRDTLGLGEELLLCDLDDDGQPIAHVIYPDLATVWVDVRRPGVLRGVYWWEPHPFDFGKWVHWHIQMGKEPRYWATNEKGEDITGDLRGGATDFPWVGQDGAPLMPVVMHHRNVTGYAWDPYTGAELVDGALQLSLLYTHYSHIIRQAAWKQRYMVGGKFRGAEMSEDGSSKAVVADPAVVLDIEADEGATQPMIGQWDQSADPEKIIASIRIYERRLVEQAAGGVEVTRETSDIRSGYSLAVGREERLSQQQMYAPVFRSVDRQKLRIWSELLAVSRGVSYPTSWPTRLGPTRQDPADIEYTSASPVEVPTEALSTDNQ